MCQSIPANAQPRKLEAPNSFLTLSMPNGTQRHRIRRHLPSLIPIDEYRQHLLVPNLVARHLLLDELEIQFAALSADGLVGVQDGRNSRAVGVQLSRDAEVTKRATQDPSGHAVCLLVDGVDFVFEEENPLPVDPPLLGTCKQIRTEASEVYGKNYFKIVLKNLNITKITSWMGLSLPRMALYESAEMAIAMFFRD